MRYCAKLLRFFTLAALFWTLVLPGRAQSPGTNILPRATLAARYFGADAPWYETNIPFFDCADTELQDIYYYRWKLYKAHLRDEGAQGYVVTEFLNDVSWARQPTQTTNDATGFHIHEGRWLRDPRFMDDYVDAMYEGAGNDRHFSEAIAEAVYSRFLADGNRAAAVRHLSAMQYVFNGWHDHYDPRKGLYYIEPISDATEYSISSVDASGGKDGFRGGDAFRPSINAFQFANAVAIGKIAALDGDTRTAQTYAATANVLRQSVQSQLWSDALSHFIDRYKVSNANVHYGDFIRGRELAGYAPWYFELPDSNPKYMASWGHLLSPLELGGAFGLRTVEPSYPYYMKQYRYDAPTGLPECQWNGPAWPFQTTYALGGLANVLNDYTQTKVTRNDYVRLLRQYAHLHYVNGEPDLQEDYNPDTGHVIVGLPRSHHYNHSGFDDLVITGLVGLRPRADNVLEVNPLVPTDPRSPQFIRGFCLENVPYHGHLVTVLYDSDGRRYGRGKGLSVFVDGKRAATLSLLGRVRVSIPAPVIAGAPMPRPVNVAVNIARVGYPAPLASVNDTPDDLFKAIDGRVWFFPNVPHSWTNAGSGSPSDWYGVDFGQAQRVSSVALYFYSDGGSFRVPSRVTLQYWTGTQWVNVPGVRASPPVLLTNGENTLRFGSLKTARLRAVFTNPARGSVALVQMKAYP